MILEVVAFIEFFSVLDDMNNIVNNAYPQTEMQIQSIRSFIVLNMLLYFLPSIAQGVTYCAYVNELGLYLDENTDFAKQ